MIQSSDALFLLEFASISLGYLLDALQLRHILILFRGHAISGHMIPTKVMDYPIKAVSRLRSRLNDVPGPSQSKSL